MRKTAYAILFSLFIFCFAGCGQTVTDYALPENWACLETEDIQKSVDVFFLCPTVFGGSDEQSNMSLDDVRTKSDFLGAVNMEKGIYDGDARFFAPYYRQMGLQYYELPVKERETYLETAYSDVQAAFDYYMKHYNQGRPIIVAGFSQGADHSLRLLKDRFADEGTRSLLVACYAIGWRITQEELEEYPHLRFASGADDTGVIVSFNTEAEAVSDSLMIPAGTRTLAINPLTWTRDGDPAPKELNLGACFTDYGGNIASEIPQLTGAYIDPERGALKVPDIDPAAYPAGIGISGFPEGVYHIYDYQFFYRNLQENVGVRIKAFDGGSD